MTTPRDRLHRASRFFARPESFTLECPHCGIIYRVRSRIKTASWNPATSRFRCEGAQGCGRTYLIGLVAWPIIQAPFVASQTPEDQVPHPRQLAQMRKEGGGWWLSEEDGIRFRRPSESNLTIEEDRPDDTDDDED
jgi:hypothetical protein